MAEANETEASSPASEPSREESILDELAQTETIRKLLECPICLDLPLPPIYVCNKGHIVCNNCRALTYSCPLCKDRYSSTTRGFVAEGLIEKLSLKCKFADSGCPLTMRGSALVDHLEKCDYRPVKCVDCGGKQINFETYEDHLLKLHKIKGIYQSRAYVIYSMNLDHQIEFGERCCWPQYYLKAFDDVTFLLRLYATHWFVCAWISLLGPKDDCGKYEAMLEFHPTHDDSVVHTWKGPVNHFRDDPAKQIFLGGRGLLTPMETLMQMAPMANGHVEWLYNIEILQAGDKEEDLEPGEVIPEEGAEGSPPSNETNEGGGDAPGPVQVASDPPPQRIVSRIGGDLVRILPTPRLGTGPGSALRTARRFSTTGMQTGSTQSRAGLGSSSSLLATAAAATVASVLSMSSSFMEMQNSSAAAAAASPSTSTGSPAYHTGRSETAAGARAGQQSSPSARLLSIRRLPLRIVFPGDSPARRAYGFTEEDWESQSSSDDSQFGTAV